MTRVRLESPISDALSPDRSICEHCGVPIGWDDYGYTHMDTGFADCGVVISGGTQVGGGLVVDPEISGGGGTSAEPREWFRDA